jgi:hypothetical protein
MDPETGKKYPRDENGLPTCPICCCMCQAAYKVGSHHVILTLRHQGKLRDEAASIFPSAQERERQADFTKGISDVIESSLGLAFQNQITTLCCHHQFPSLKCCYSPTWFHWHSGLQSSPGRDVHACLKRLGCSFQARCIYPRQRDETA